MKNLFANWRADLPASLVVFLVALPLCLGIALASTASVGTPILFSGIIAGVIGGVVVGFLSGSRLGVSGPAAGVIMIVVTAISSIGSFEGFLVAVVLAGVIQVFAGFLGAGVLGNYFPSSVIKGMLAAIGLTLILKEIPHAIGYDKDFMGDEAFFQIDGHNTLSDLLRALDFISPGAVIISLLSIGILILFDRPFMKRFGLFKILPGALFVVLIGILLNLLFKWYAPGLYVSGKHLVELPVARSWKDLQSFFTFPDFTVLWTKPAVYGAALTLGLVASLESLLSVQATDKLDPKKYSTPTNRELRAQGVGNIISGLIGGLPITQVIVRSSANIGAGGESRLSTILHGILLALCVLLIPTVLNLIPLASLAAVLLMVGYKLSRVQLYKQMYALGVEQYLPFIATIVGVLFTDLLRGIAIGMGISIFFILRKNYRNNYVKRIVRTAEQTEIHLQLSEEVTFLNKGSISECLQDAPKNAIVTIDGSNCKAIDHDVLELIQDFKLHGAPEKNIRLITIDIPAVEVADGH